MDNAQCLRDCVCLVLCLNLWSVLVHQPPFGEPRGPSEKALLRPAAFSEVAKRTEPGRTDQTQHLQILAAALVATSLTHRLRLDALATRSGVC